MFASQGASAAGPQAVGVVVRLLRRVCGGLERVLLVIAEASSLPFLHVYSLLSLRVGTLVSITCMLLNFFCNPPICNNCVHICAIF